MKYDVKNLIDDIVNFENSPDYRKLNNYYSKPSIFSILGTSRSENRHSNFIAWLLTPNPEKNNHGMGDFGVRKLLEVLAYISRKPEIKHSKNKFPEEHDKLDIALITGTYSLTDVEVEREVSLEHNGVKGRLDILIKGKISYYNKKDIPITIAIENKILSSEHDEQTTTYWGDLYNKKETSDILLGIYLTPLNNYEYEKLDKTQCTSEGFIQLNYQYLSDYVITPCRELSNNKTITQYIDEYMLALSSPELRENESVIMAYTQDELRLLSEFWNKNANFITEALETTIKILSGKIGSDEESMYDLFLNFWNKNENLLMIVLEAIISNDNNLQNKETIIKNIKTLKEYKNRYICTLIENGRPLSKGDMVVTIITHYTENNDNVELKILQEKFPINKISKIPKGCQVVDTLETAQKQKKPRHYLPDNKIITALDSDSKEIKCAICNNWFDDNFKQFMDCASELGYIIEPYKIIN